MLPYLVIGILLLGMLAVLAVALLALVMATWRLQLPCVEEVEVGDYPADQLDRQKNLGAKMEEAGFVFAGMQRERRGPQFEVWQALFRTQNRAVWGVVEAMEGERPRIVFHSFFPDGTAVTTSDGDFADYHLTDEWQLTAKTFGRLREQAIVHQERSLETCANPLALKGPEEFREKYGEIVRNQFAHLQSLGFLREDPEEDDEFRVVPWKSPRIALRMLIHARRYRWSAQGSHGAEERQTGEVDEAEREEYSETEEYKYLEQYRRDRKKGTVLSLLGWTPRSALLFVAILVLLVIALTGDKLSVTSAVIILGVLLVHDLGHVAAMCVFGYRDFSILIIPLVGRLAEKGRIRVPAWQEFVILMMGPLPGLIFGWAVLVLAFFHPSLPEFWQRVGLWSALINNVNLLAVLPCDGGRIVNLLVFERLPGLRAIYVLLSGVAIVLGVLLLTLSLGPATLAVLWPFLVLGIFAFLALPKNIRLGRMAPWAKHNLSVEEDETDALLKAFMIVERTGGGKGLARKGWTDSVDAVLKYGCSKKMGLLGTISALLVFLLFLQAPLWVFVGVTLGEGARVASEHRELQQRIDLLAPRVSWGGAVVTKKTRHELETLRDSYLGTLEILYHDGKTFPQDSLDYDSRGIFDPSEAIEMLRKLRWDEVATWIAEGETNQRQDAARILVEALIGDSREKAAGGNLAGAMVGYSKAYWAISTCEPKTSLAAWIDWLYLERALLLEIESLMSKKGIPREYSSWFAATLRNRPRFEGDKMALLLLYDLQGGAAFVPRKNSAAESLSVKEVLADVGYPLRRSAADRDFRREVGLPQAKISLSTAIGATRSVQGLPTREEYRAGIVVAEHWENRTELDHEVLGKLDDPEQQKIWKARIDRLLRLHHFRLLAVAAFEIELASLGSAGEAPLEPAGPPLPVRTSLVKAPGNRYAAASTAPDGTRFVWELSPQFATRRRAH